ncbi:hypothetical protein ACFPPD_18860 [Cohnella suwonensis]|uniref:Uncharacterized protein n=1 Tax=Cohnella suwonensis TaxID=696072 RepID=A0ABW0M0Q0_9BACL
MESVVLNAMAYVLLLVVGLRSIGKNGRKREMAMYAGLIGWSAYMSFAQRLHWPSGSLADLQYMIVAPVGQWINHWLGSS